MPRSADWFASLTKKAQKEYIAKHPNSKYAKGAKPAASGTAARDKLAATMRATAHKNLIANVKKAETKLAAETKRLSKAKTPAEKKVIQSAITALKKLITTGNKSIVASQKRLGKTVKATPKVTAKKPTAVSAKTVKTAHDKKRVTDKNKAIAKTPSAKKSVIKPISGKTPAETKLKQRIAGLRLSLQMQKTGTPEYKRRKAQYDKLREQLKAMKK